MLNRGIMFIALILYTNKKPQFLVKVYTFVENITEREVLLVLSKKTSKLLLKGQPLEAMKI